MQQFDSVRNRSGQEPCCRKHPLPHLFPLKGPGVACFAIRILLVTLDVSSLYTNILHDKGVNVCKEFLNTRIDQSPLTKDLCQLIQLILENNVFTLTEHIIYNYKEQLCVLEWHHCMPTCSWENLNNSS